MAKTTEVQVAKSRHGSEVGGREHYTFLPMRRLCASTAATKFSKPATTTNLVP